MKSDELLTDLTPCTIDASLLVAAARRHTRHRRQLQLATGLAALLLVIAAIRFLPLHDRADTVPEVVATAPPVSPMLTKHELLNSFGDQPVALVVWPDGRQQLLAIARPVPRRPAPR